MLCSLVCSCGRGKSSSDTGTPTISNTLTADESVLSDTLSESFIATAPETDAEPDAEYAGGFNSVYQIGYASMNVNNIMQEEIGMPYGCEAVSLAMTLEYFGYEIDPRILFYGFMPHGDYGTANPYYEYVGDPTDRTGYGCYAPCVVETANEYLTYADSDRRAVDISGSSIYELLGYIWNGYPVIIWGTLDMTQYSDVLDTWYFDGEKVNWYSLSHCVVISGVEGDDFIICDPMVGEVRYSIEEVQTAYELIYSQAVVIY